MISRSNLTAKSRKKLMMGATALGLSALVVAPAFSANAEDKSAFRVSAQDVNDPDIVANAGMDPTPAPALPGGTAGPGETTAPGATTPPSVDPTDTVLYSYSCGPMTLDITQSMVDKSQANQAALDAGQPTTPDPSGWTIIRDPLTKKAITETKPANVTTGDQLNASSELIHTSGPSRSGWNDCEIIDRRNAGQLGARVGFQMPNTNNSADYSDSKVVELAGEKIIEKITVRAGEVTEVFRSQAASPFVSSNTAKYPQGIKHVKDPRSAATQQAQGSPDQTRVVQTFNIGTQNVVQIATYKTGEYREQYVKYGSIRANGAPAKAVWMNDTFVGYEPGDSLGLTIKYTPSTLEQWNAANGTNWDGKKTDLTQFAGMEQSFTPSAG